MQKEKHPRYWENGFGIMELCQQIFTIWNILWVFCCIFFFKSRSWSGSFVATPTWIQCTICIVSLGMPPLLSSWGKNRGVNLQSLGVNRVLCCSCPWFFQAFGRFHDLLIRCFLCVCVCFFLPLQHVCQCFIFLFCIVAGKFASYKLLAADRLSLYSSPNATMAAAKRRWTMRLFS